MGSFISDSKQREHDDVEDDDEDEEENDKEGALEDIDLLITQVESVQRRLIKALPIAIQKVKAKIASEEAKLSKLEALRLMLNPENMELEEEDEEAKPPPPKKPLARSAPKPARVTKRDKRGTITKQLQIFRTARGLSQRGLSILAGVYQGTVSRLELGAIPSQQTFEALKKVIPDLKPSDD